MAKKAANPEFNMSEAIREVFTADPKVSAKDAVEAILAKHPSAKINKNSFSVAFYTVRKKLGIKGNGRSRGRSRKAGISRGVRATLGKSLNLATLQTTARFLSEVGGAEIAFEAIKQVQAIQVK